MKIIANNHADSIRRPDARETVEATVLDTVREELLSYYGNAERDLPAELAALAHRLDHAPIARGAGG
jgi:hypothetical protein